MDWFLYDNGLRYERVNSKRHFYTMRIRGPFQFNFIVILNIIW